MKQLEKSLPSQKMLGHINKVKYTEQGNKIRLIQDHTHWNHRDVAVGNTRQGAAQSLIIEQEN